ncbi:uncharacterized protein LOC130734368 isoform X2 [Lotus japonicus]|uniref:uncharacterized protein LOC130734368 isoform X2 n=1 Tax=Lotus japonicus TaxID=34305 RepID=UPI002589BD05|nr:uncharacterized protein LOC130734368 isoform X2 [Lotus japonicus]
MIGLSSLLTEINGRLRKSVKKNAKNRSKLTVNHTGGSKKLKRRKYEMEAKTKKEISRGALYVETHKKHDGTFINEEAQAICEKISYIESQGTTSSKPSKNDSLGQVLGVERHGRVQGMSFGVCPSQVFGSRFERFCGTTPSSSTAGATELQLQFEVEKLQSKAASDSQLMKEMTNTIALLCQKIDVPVPPKFSLVASEPTVEDTAAQASNQEDANQSENV